jgi:PAS domain S-box-containing protein
LTPAKVALIYALAGSFWILFTDYLAAQLFLSKAAITEVEIVKGCFFIGTTSLMLYALVRRSVEALRRSEREQRESKARLQSLIENLPFDFWATDASGRYIMENAYTVRRWGELIGKRPEEVGAPPDVLALWLDNNRRALSGELVQGEAKYNFCGDVRTIYNVLAPVRDNNEIRGIVGINIDITKLREAEEALRESEEWFRRRYEAISVGLLVYDLSGAIAYANRAAGDILDKPVDQLLGETPFGPEWRAVREDMSSFPPEDYPAMMTVRTGEPVSNVVLGISRGPDSERRWLLVNSRPVIDPETSGLREVVVTFVDITPRKRAESGLQENEAVLRLFVEHTPAAVAMFDRDIRYLWYTKRWLSDYRLGDRDITGLSHYEVFPEVPERWKEIHQRVLAGAVERCEADPFPRMDGTEDWVRWEVRPWWNSECEIGGIIMFTEVITDEVLAKEALQESESKFRSLVDNIPDVVWTTDREGNTSFISPNVEELLGYTPEEIYESGEALWFGAVHPEDVDLVRQAFGALFDKGEQYDVEYRLRTRDSRWIWIHDRSISTYHKDGKWFADGILSDITEHKHAEDVLRDSEQRLSDIINFLPDATFAIDLDGKVITWNRATEVLTGINAEDMLGKGNYAYSIPFYGVRCPLLIDLVLKPDETSERQYLSIERDNGTLVAETYATGLRPGGAYIWGKATPLYDRGGRIVGAIESVRDITDRRKSEDQLKERTELLQTVMDNIPQSLFWKDMNLVYLGGNRSFAEVVGLKGPE